VTESEFDPLEIGIPRATLADLRGGDAAANAAVVRDVLGGARGPVRDAVVLNAAAGLVALDPDAAGSVTARIGAALLRAGEAIDSGAAAGALARWVAATR
jgi:anthranilate phosphoribosyltransferase